MLRQIKLLIIYVKNCGSSDSKTLSRTFLENASLVLGTMPVQAIKLCRISRPQERRLTPTRFVSRDPTNVVLSLSRWDVDNEEKKDILHYLFVMLPDQSILKYSTRSPWIRISMGSGDSSHDVVK